MVDRSADGRLSPKLMSFDVFGTLVDVRGSSYAAFESILRDSGATHVDVKAFWEHWEERNIAHYWEPYRRYRDICELSLAETFAHFGIKAPSALIQRYFDAFSGFQVFPDVAPTLDRLAKRYRLAVVSNIDDDLFAETPLGRTFDLVCTAERAGGYKPDGTLFKYLIANAGCEPRRDPALGTVAVHRHGRRQAARADHRLDQPPRRRAASVGAEAGFPAQRRRVAD